MCCLCWALLSVLLSDPLLLFFFIFPLCFFLLFTLSLNAKSVTFLQIRRLGVFSNFVNPLFPKMLL